MIFFGSKRRVAYAFFIASVPITVGGFGLFFYGIILFLESKNVPRIFPEDYLAIIIPSTLIFVGLTANIASRKFLRAIQNESEKKKMPPPLSR